MGPHLPAEGPRWGGRVDPWGGTVTLGANLKVGPPPLRTAGDRRRSLAGLPRAGTVPPGAAEVPANAQPERRTLIARSQGGPPPPTLGPKVPPPHLRCRRRSKVGWSGGTPPSGRGSKVGWQGRTLRVPPWGGTPGGVPCKVGLSTLKWLLLRVAEGPGQRLRVSGDLNLRVPGLLPKSRRAQATPPSLEPQRRTRPPGRQPPIFRPRKSASRFIVMSPGHVCLFCSYFRCREAWPVCKLCCASDVGRACAA